MTLIDEINGAKITLRELQRAVAQQQARIKELEYSRFDCDHEWGQPIKNYEHEGEHCIKCGINSIFWECNKPLGESK